MRRSFFERFILFISLFFLTLGKTWIGASKLNSSEDWIWAATSRKFNGYTNWNVGEPSGDGNCAQINILGKWNDVDCSKTLMYVCDIV